MIEQADKSVSAIVLEVVPSALADERLDRIVALIGDLSRSEASRTIKAGGVRLDGDPRISGRVRVRLGQTVTIDPAAVPSRPVPVADPEVKFRVVHQDDDFIVIDKPAGLIVHPGVGNEQGTLVHGLLARFPELAEVGDPIRPGIVHRLDAGTSGLLVVARNDASVTGLITQFAEHTANRVYSAVVWGSPKALHGIIDAPLGRSITDPLRMAVVVGGQPSRTNYRVTRSYRFPALVSLLECRLETGRTHQIRVHLSSINHPLVGDPIYGQHRPSLGLHRPFLHASQLAFDHPITGSRVTFEAPLSADLMTWLDAAEI